MSVKPRELRRSLVFQRNTSGRAGCSFAPVWTEPIGNRVATSMVPEDDPLLPLKCPECEHVQAHISVRSQTILTLKCAHCRHSWSTLIAMLPESVLKQLPPR